MYIYIYITTIIYIYIYTYRMSAPEDVGAAVDEDGLVDINCNLVDIIRVDLSLYRLLYVRRRRETTRK